MKGGKTLSVMRAGAKYMRFTLAATDAMDGRKLPLFVICEGNPGGSVQNQLPKILPNGIIGCAELER